MADRLRTALSPYLRAHADNPVDWHEWGQEAFDEARRRDVPVLLSVGYAACHWCHVIDRTLRTWQEITKQQVRGTISVRAGSARIAV